MTENSLICQFIANNPDVWRELMDDLNIKVKEKSPYAIFNYGAGADFGLDLVQEARGIIINIEDLSVACWPFRKFGNYTEDYADDIDWSTALLQEKIDGSIVKLWYDGINKKWRWSTNGMIDASDANVMGQTELTFMDVIKQSDEYAMLLRLMNPIDGNASISQRMTYIFELVGPDVPIVIHYPKTKLYHLGTRSNFTGHEFDTNIGIPQPKRWKVNDLSMCVWAASQLNQNVDCVEDEGYVVVDAKWHRIKVKSPKYIEMHRKSNNHMFSKGRVVDMLRSGDTTISELCKNFPDFAHIFKYYDYKITELYIKAKRYCQWVDALFIELKGNNKDVALRIKNDDMAAIGFTHLNYGKTSQEILDAMSLSKILKYIPDYSEEEHGFANAVSD